MKEVYIIIMLCTRSWTGVGYACELEEPLHEYVFVRIEDCKHVAADLTSGEIQDGHVGYYCETVRLIGDLGYGD